MTTTYSIQDDKLRHYETSKEKWPQFKAAGFLYAPRQGCYVQVWTPEREDLCLAFDDDIDDEDITLAERAEVRAGRFVQYSENAEARSDQAHAAAEQLAQAIPLGQPILVGHHSERRARKDAERIENGFRKAYGEMKKAEYWRERAHRAKRNAARTEAPQVVYNRIKRLEAELRKHERAVKDNSPEAILGALFYDYKWKGQEKTLDELRTEAQQVYEESQARHLRWIEHLENRLAYERELYADQGKAGADAVGVPLEKGGAVYLNCYAGKGWRPILRVNKGQDGQVSTIAIPSDVSWRKTWNIEPTKVKAILTAAEVGGRDMAALPLPDIAIAEVLSVKPPQPDGRAEELRQKAEQAANREIVVNYGELYPTPVHVVEMMVDEIGPEPDGRFLEPSAGGGAILDYVTARWPWLQAHAIELDYNTFRVLSERKNQQSASQVKYHQGDFLEATPETTGWGKMNYILMNPPFSEQQDIKHVLYAFDKWLSPGGILVAIVSKHIEYLQTNEAERLRQMIEGTTIVHLPAGTFTGTKIQTIMITLHKWQ